VNRFLLPLAASVFFLCGPVQAGLEGDYELISGTSKCPMGSLQTLVFKDNPGKRVFLFGSRHAWSLDMVDKSETKEVGETGCNYVQAYQKTEKRFVSRTTRSNCPSKTANGVVTEKMTLQGSKLVYEFASGKTNFRCQYKKTG
jgi:hypothetical protein